jgi:molecular chaperone DnaJ
MSYSLQWGRSTPHGAGIVPRTPGSGRIMKPDRDYYKILGIAKSATLNEIKSRFRRLALRYHPDRNLGNSRAEERFKLVAEAYHVLSDRHRRRLYNERGHQGLRDAGFQGFRHSAEVFSTLGGELFAFLGISGKQPHRGPLPGADLCLTLALSPLEAAEGVQKSLEITRMEGCKHCEGTGVRPRSGRHPCPTCGGSGTFSGSLGIFAAADACPRCSGDGRVAQVSCTVCEGRGRYETRHVITVAVPGGAREGMRLKFPREGDGGDYGARPGDLYLELRIRPEA